MSGPSTYVPKSAIGRWFESRLPLGGLVHSSFIAYPVPRNLNYMWTFGAILSFMLVAQIVTGVVLPMHFIPSSTQAFASVENIMRNVNYGWLIRYLHSNGASLFFFACYIHMAPRPCSGASLDHRRHHLRADDGDGFFRLCFALGRDELRGGDRHHQPHLGNSDRRQHHR